MKLLRFFQRGSSAPVARDRLQVLLSHERGLVGGQSDLVNDLREEILAVIARHVPVDRDAVQVRMERGPALSTLEIEVEVPHVPAMRRAVGA
jgi:cell division topological specificity factor